MIKKILSKSGNIYLVQELKREKGIIIGNAVRLTKTKTDTYYFMKNIQIINENSIISISNPPENEIDFFLFLEEEKELIPTKKILEPFNVYSYLEDWQTTPHSLLAAWEQKNSLPNLGGPGASNERH